MTTTKQYDFLNRLTQISSAPSGAGLLPYTYAYNYNAANQRARNTFSDGSHWSYQYDWLGQVTNGGRYWSDGTPVAGQQYQYLFDTIGNRTKTWTGGDTNGANLRPAIYTVNSLNQITQRDVPGTNDVIGAALVGTNVTVNGVAADRKAEYFHGVVGTNNASQPFWLTSTIIGANNTLAGRLYVAKEPEQFQYDADGNLTSDGRWTYTWDGENRLIGMTVNTSAGPLYQLTFAYDWQGRRIQKIVATNGLAYGTNNFVYDGWNLAAELKPNNSLIRSYVWGTDLSGQSQGAGGVGGLLETRYYGTTTTNAFVAFDGNGNVSALVNAADGTVVANYEYGPFGEVIRNSGPLAKNNPLRFSTKYCDDESDLFYYGYRYYKASTGIWLSRDPIEEDGGNNVYSVVSNDLLNKADYLGKYEIDFHFYVVYYLLRSKCFSASDAYDIAYNSQNVDDDRSTNPQILGEREFVANFISIPMYNYWAQRLARYHFFNSTQSRGTVAGDPEAIVRTLSNLLSWKSGSGSAVETGISLHVLADTWAHHDFTAFWNTRINGAANANHSDLTEDPDFGNYPAIGHTKYGHRPDEPYLRPQLALHAAETIYNLIPKKDGCGCTALPWSTVMSDLQTQFSNSGSEYERARAGQQMIESRFGDNVWYPDHSF